MRLIWTGGYLALALSLASAAGAAADSSDAQVSAPAAAAAANSGTVPSPLQADEPLTPSLPQSVARLPVAEAGDNDGVARGAGATVFLSRDNENFSTQRIAVEYLPRYKHIDALSGMRYTDYRYQQDGWSRGGQQLTFLHRNIDPATARGWQLEAGLLRQGGYDLLTADGVYRATVLPRTGVELVVNREVVDTVNALNGGVYFTLAGAGVEQAVNPHITVVGWGARQAFSDGNNRDHMRLKLIVQPNLDLGLTLQMRYRSYTSSEISAAYFNPSRYDEMMLAVGWRQRITGWTASLTAGSGEQHVAADPGSPTWLLELALQNPTDRDYALRVRGGLNQSATFNGPNYRYSYFQAEWILKF